MTNKEKLIKKVGALLPYCTDSKLEELVVKKLIKTCGHTIYGGQFVRIKKNITIVKLKEIISICREAKND